MFLVIAHITHLSQEMMKLTWGRKRAIQDKHSQKL